MNRFNVRPLFAAPLAAGIVFSAFGSNPYAVEVVSYDQGAADTGLTDPSVVLGEPTRYTGQPLFPAVVSAFNPPWTAFDIVSIGPGGHLVIRFETPVTNHPDNPFGIDFLIFGNTGFIDANWPNGIVGEGLFGDDGGTVEVSSDGDQWFLIPDVRADGLYPTIGYLDAGPYDIDPGIHPTNFTRPVNPSLTLDDFVGLTHEQVIELYDGSGGGTGVDIGATGLNEILYVRISNPANAKASVEIDGFARVSQALTGDLNGDGVVDVFDLLILLAGWGACPAPGVPGFLPGPNGGCPADLNGDGVVDVFDLLLLLANWGQP